MTKVSEPFALVYVVLIMFAFPVLQREREVNATSFWDVVLLSIRVDYHAIYPLSFVAPAGLGYSKISLA